MIKTDAGEADFEDLRREPFLMQNNNMRKRSLVPGVRPILKLETWYNQDQ